MNSLRFKIFLKIFFITFVVLLFTKLQASDEMTIRKVSCQITIPVAMTTQVSPVVDNPAVELIYFSCKKTDSKVVLNWRTASELNVNFYITEKSTDSTNFKEIGYVKGAGKSLRVNDYSYEDPNLDTKVTYYRLKYFSFDGHFGYSSIIALNKDTTDYKPDPKLHDHQDN